MTKPTERAWSLITKSRSGEVSILKELTLQEVKGAYQRLNPEFGQTYASYETENEGSVSFGLGRIMSEGEIEVREVIGPLDWDQAEMRTWDEWPKHDFIRLDDPRHFKNEQHAQKEG